MASTYTSRLKLERQASGENSGNWGNLVNYVLNRIDSTVRGYTAVDVAGSANVTLTSNTSTTNTDDDATDDQVHNKVIEFTGALTGDIYVFTDAVEGDYTLFNNTTGSQTLTFANTGHAANGVAITQGQKALVYTTGTAIVDVLAGSGLLSEIVEDTTPQLGGNLDTNGNNILIDSGSSINDENDLEQIKFATTASAVNEFTVTNAATGNAPEISATGGDTNIDLNLTPKGIGRTTFNGQGKIESVAEKVTTEATAATGTVNYDVLTQAVWNFTTDATGNRTLNIRGDGSNSLNSIMDIGESITIAHIVSQGGTAYYNSAVQIDGASVTPEYQGGAAPTAGNADSLDAYSYTIIKTADATFTVLASQTQFA